MACHCLVCGKEYKYWGCIHNHYKKEHPDNKFIFRTVEIIKSMNEEAESFIKYSKVGDWLGDK